MKAETIKIIASKRNNVRAKIILYKDKEGNSVFLIQTKRLLENGKILKSDLYLRPETFLMMEELFPLFLTGDNVAKLEVIDDLAEFKVTKSKLYKYQNKKLYKQ